MKSAEEIRQLETVHKNLGLKPFSLTSRCDKCGHWSVRLEHTIFKLEVTKEKFISVEYLECTCNGCVFKWNMHTKDKK